MANPPPSRVEFEVRIQRKPRLMKDWENVGKNLQSVFSSLAALKADITIDETAESDQFTWLNGSVGWLPEIYNFQIDSHETVWF